MTLAPSQPPDLLRRFAPTPFRSLIETSQGILSVRSNDGAFSYYPKPKAFQAAKRVYDCVLVRDDAVPTRPRTLLLSHDDPITVLIAEGAHLHFDREKSLILGFARNTLDTAVILYWIERLLTFDGDTA